MTSPEKSVSIASECVSNGHPDKVADQIADSILDHYLSRYQGDQDALEQVRCAVEVFVAGERIVLGGEIKLPDADPQSDREKSVRKEVVGDTLKRIGYDAELLPVGQRRMSAQNAEIFDCVLGQSTELNQVVSKGAGDQGMMYGYAVRPWFSPEQIFTAEYVAKMLDFNFMPPQLAVCRALMLQLSEYREQHPECGLFPDAKAFAVLQPGREDMPVKHLAISVWNRLEDAETKHQKDQKKLLQVVREAILDRVFNADFLARCTHANQAGDSTKQVQLQINAGGTFTEGGPQTDSGLTGRKIIVDTYGGAAAHGGGAFSGKDASKVDRSGAYYTRYLARKLLKENPDAREVNFQIGYVIGAEKPQSSYAIIKCKDNKSEPRFFDEDELWTVQEIIRNFNLRKPRFADLAANGHIGRPELPWEQVD